MKYTNNMKIRGELACNRLSEKATKFYSETDPLMVYEYEKEGRTLYAYKGNFKAEDLTFEELERDFEELQEELEKIYD